jgi:hypothetical protein
MSYDVTYRSGLVAMDLDPSYAAEFWRLGPAGLHTLHGMTGREVLSLMSTLPDAWAHPALQCVALAARLDPDGVVDTRYGAGLPPWDEPPGREIRVEETAALGYPCVIARSL